MKKNIFSRPLDLKQVEITDDFWGREQELVRTEVIPYQWEALNDRVPGADPSFCMRNFSTAGKMMRAKREKTDFVAPAYSFRGFNALPEEGKGLEEDTFYGFVFQDSDFSKWIEAVGYSLMNHLDEQLERTADEAIDIVCAAQAPNGYLDTYYIINGMDRIFTNLKDHHELYCMGHLIEGAVAYYQATGKDKLLKAAMRYADFACAYFGLGEGQCKGYPGHEIAEMALTRLYEVTGERKYLELSRFFLDMRGREPFYFDSEDEERAKFEGRPWRPNDDPMRYAYYQSHLPVRRQTEAVGHAVRAVYLYSGMADVARLTQDSEMLSACKRLWKSITSEKLYITGGIGGTHLGEAFSFPYDLPNDTAYSETCAAIGLAFFARRMLELETVGEYADVMEQALYNTVLAGMALDGKSFFYVNPLEVYPAACKMDGRKAHVKPVRQKWFGCACCPPNIARIVGSVGAYLYTEQEDTLFVHLYAGSRVRKQLGENTLELELESSFPWEGEAKATLHTPGPVKGTLAFRIPGWCQGNEQVQVEVLRASEKTQSRETLCGIGIAEGRLTSFATREEPATMAAQTATMAARTATMAAQDAGSSALPMEITMREGYLYLTEIWQEGDEILLHFPMEVHCVQANSRVRENIGKVAFTRGPICYCMEQADNGADLQLCRADVKGTALKNITVEPFHKLGYEMRSIKIPGKRYMASPETDTLYSQYMEPQKEDATLTLIPYYAWNNRGEGEMSVWIGAE